MAKHAKHTTVAPLQSGHGGCDESIRSSNVSSILQKSVSSGRVSSHRSERYHATRKLELAFYANCVAGGESGTQDASTKCYVEDRPRRSR